MIDRAQLSRIVTAAHGRLRAAYATLQLDKLDVLMAVGLGFVCYGVAQLYSPDHAYIIGGAGLLVFASVGLLWRLRASRQG